MLRLLTKRTTRPILAQNTLDSFLGTSPASNMAPKKRPAPPPSSSTSAASPSKKTKSHVEQGKKNAKGDLGHRATADELNVEKLGLNDRGETPYHELMRVQKEGGVEAKEPGDAVVYWMRMKDLRIDDNRALAHASSLAKSTKRTLIALFVLSPSDYRAHHRSARRIDFVLRHLSLLHSSLKSDHNIPLVVLTSEKRKAVPSFVLERCKEWKAGDLVANIEHEVDELRRDIETYQKGREDGMGVTFLNDFCAVKPGQLVTQQGKPYSVYSPWFRNWASTVNSSLSTYLDSAGLPSSNPSPVPSPYSSLFSHPPPASLDGFSLTADDAANMKSWWPAGPDKAEACLSRFFTSLLTEGTFDQPPFNSSDQSDADANPVPTKEGGGGGKAGKGSRVDEYSTARNRPDLPGTSRLSPYLAAGVISVRRCLRFAKQAQDEARGAGKGGKKLETERASGIGMWVGELAWRDFYQHVLVAWPRVCMNKAFQTKYDKVKWEYDDGLLDAWKEGRTGFPFIDAAMRQVQTTGYMHNRARMAVASFLCKDLMLDWREGERWFMENLIDGDFAANNGGWQWSASTGTDPQPYFRIFAPLSQSEKSDPDGKYILAYVPELRGLSGKALHDPTHHLSAKELEKRGYPKQVVDHAKARKRALARYKEPGSNADE